MTWRTRPDSPYRALITVGLAITFAGSNQATAKYSKDAEMTQPPMTLWQTIDTLAQQIPFTQAKIERLLGVALSDTDPRTLVFQPTSSRFLEGGPVTLANDVEIENVDLRVKHREGHPGFLVLNLSGRCIDLGTVRVHYLNLRVTDRPRGRSLDEVTSYTTVLPWGELSFSFKERNPDCLSSIAFAPMTGKTNTPAN